jgi:transposase-like protein
MTTRYRVTFEIYDESTEGRIVSSTKILDEALVQPTNCFDYGMRQENQIALIQLVQDNILSAKTRMFINTEGECPQCKTKLIKYGKSKSRYYDVYTDHKVHIQRLRCDSCGYEAPRSIKGIFQTDTSADLKKIQATLGAEHSYRDSENIFELFSTTNREINNHDRIKHTTESVGRASSLLSKDESAIMFNEDAKELILNVDGGHVKTTEDKRSIEAMTSVIYKPESIQSNKKGTRNILTSKHCAASVQNDNQQEIITNTIVAALKQGIGENTHVTALSDGADNCWNVINAIKPFCGSMTSILDWFHVAMKVENISLPKDLKERLTRVKWHLWRGNTEYATIRLEQLVKLAKKDKDIDKIKKFLKYVINNKERIVDYRARQKAGLVFTSNLAESTVESLINQRCKGQQHMRWSREGLNPVLQLRAAIHSNDWQHKWKDVVLNAA